MALKRFKVYNLHILILSASKLDYQANKVIFSSVLKRIKIIVNNCKSVFYD